MSAPSQPSAPPTSFAVVVPAQTGALERVVAIFTRVGAMPTRLASILHRRSGTLSIQIDVDDVDADRADLIAARLSALPELEKLFVGRGEALRRA